MPGLRFLEIRGAPAPEGHLFFFCGSRGRWRVTQPQELGLKAGCQVVLSLAFPCRWRCTQQRALVQPDQILVPQSEREADLEVGIFRHPHTR
jgi:hypothetical protein